MSFAAPLNYDWLFEKVFSNLSIAKAFLEDCSDVSLDPVPKLKDENEIINEYGILEFHDHYEVESGI